MSGIDKIEIPGPLLRRLSANDAGIFAAGLFRRLG